MNDDTGKLLKVFGVAVTDAEAEAERLAGTAAQLSASASKEEVAKLLKDASELCRELNTRWLEITQRVFAVQSRLQTELAEAARKLSGTESPCRRNAHVQVGQNCRDEGGSARDRQGRGRRGTQPRPFQRGRHFPRHRQHLHPSRRAIRGGGVVRGGRDLPLARRSIQRQNRRSAGTASPDRGAELSRPGPGG